MSNPLVSAIILTRDRPDSVRDCLRSLEAQSYRPLEIIVVDNGEADEARTLADWIDDWDCDLPVNHLRSEPIGFAALRQLGYGRATGELILSIDDDCVAAPDLVERVVQRFGADSELGMLGGAITNVGFDESERYKGRGRIGVNGRYEMVEDPHQAEVFGSANQSIRRSAFDAIGGYDPYFKDGMEEADLAISLREAGWKIAYDESIRVTHRHTPIRFRRRWRNLHRMRLYFYFKHDCPRGWGWLSFAGRETKLLVRETLALWAGRPRRGLLRAGAWALIEFWKLTVTRLMIPVILYEARES